MSTQTPTKTFSFKAPQDWDTRIARARRALSHVPDLDSPESAQILHELELAILRRPHRLTQAANTSDLMRTVVELLLIATEKVERDRTSGDEYAAAAAERSEDETDFTRASTRVAARRWR
jgi:hypothetical protein